ncbi:MAG: hypothetical protein QF733_10430, partial [Phycisphaerales bacterium]|nr:hypothetical protein [Phycisphaerales bacterium]
VGSRYATVADVPAGRVDIRTGSTWSAAVGAPEPAEDAEFGWSCALSANALVAGAPYQPDSGGVYLWSGISGPCGCQADVNGDGDVGVDDLLTVLEGWGGDGPGGDIDGDGTIGVNDLLALIAAWGPCA